MLDTIQEAITLVHKAEDALARARLILVRHDIIAIKTEPYKLLRAASDELDKFFNLLKKEG